MALSAPPALTARREVTVAELKQEVANANVAERPALCVEICERQLDAADRFYVAGDSEQGKAALVDVTAFAELARNYAIQSHKREKQSEIAIRKMAHKLANLKHTVSVEDQGQVQNTIDRLERVRDDLLAAMFPNGVKK
ncbi:MAG TPA: hypothetical protein VFF50_07795 [Candidatus Deferrimicrobiaceae bacterium]|nr:hypothetical protein [Candidatus Deferrimicrobiaceae bacterium]